MSRTKPERSRLPSLILWLSVALVWTGAGYWVVSNYPMLTNPLATFQTIADGTMSKPTLELFAAMTPLLIWAIFILVWAFLLMIIGDVYSTRRLPRALPEQD